MTFDPTTVPIPQQKLLARALGATDPSWWGEEMLSYFLLHPKRSPWRRG